MHKIFKSLVNGSQRFKDTEIFINLLSLRLSSILLSSAAYIASASSSSFSYGPLENKLPAYPLNYRENRAKM